MKAIQDQINAYENEIAQAFKHLEDEAGAYHLHAVCVHEGNADSGHYYTFIKD